MPSPLRILVVDDSALFRTHLANAIREIGYCEIVGFAEDGLAAVEQARKLLPDVITLDIEMPNLNGIEVLKTLRAEKSTSKIIMVSRLTSDGAQETTDALLQGAFDFILKPKGSDALENKRRLVADLKEKLDAVLAANYPESVAGVSTHPHHKQATYRKTDAIQRPTSSFECLIIGCSTGGPDALAHIFPDLPHDFPVPILVVQHMPEGFTKSLAKRLAEASEISVTEGVNGLALKRNSAIMAPGGLHLGLKKIGPGKVEVVLSDAPKEHNCRPAIDYTIRSAVETFGGRILILILTGMGKDGLEGCRLVSSRGGTVVAQAAEGCVVYGMPKVVTQAGLANYVAQLQDLPKLLTNLVVTASPPGGSRT